MHATLDVLGDVASLRLLRTLAEGPRRFETLVGSLGLSRAVLSARLRHLVKQQCLEATPDEGYRLTARGEDLVGGLLLLDAWNAAHRRGARAAAPRHVCGKPLIPEVRCTACDAAVDASSVKILTLTFGVTDPKGLPPLPSYRRRRSEVPARLTAHDCLGDRWVGLILGSMLFGLRRFSDLALALDIAGNILSQRLQLLVANGLVERRAREDGAHAEYVLTARARDFYPAILALLDWGERWLRPDWTATAGWNRLHRPCCEWLVPQVVCHACARPIVPADVIWNHPRERRSS
jgi:DNA-binding HxlR family transcriptional regulator